MGSFFDNLQDEMSKRDEKSKKGFSPLHLAELPPPLRKMMKIMIRKTKLTYHEVVEIMKSEDDFDQGELDTTLSDLTKTEWLIQLGEGDRSTYKVNLGRRQASGLDGSVWSAINDKLEQRIKEQQDKKKDPDSPESK